MAILIVSSEEMLFFPRMPDIYALLHARYTYFISIKILYLSNLLRS